MPEYLVRIKQFNTGESVEEGSDYDFDARVEASTESFAIEAAMVAGEPDPGEVYEVSEIHPKLVRIKSRRVNVKTVLEEVVA